MKIGDKLEGTITGIQPYGAFVELESGVTGLIHISEIRSGYVSNIHDILSIGEKVFVQVIDVDEYSKKASLSLRTLEETPQRSIRHHRFSNDRHKSGFAPLAQRCRPGLKKERYSLANKKRNKNFDRLMKPIEVFLI